MEKFFRSICAVLAVGCFAALSGSPARAADASPWVEDSYSAIRLIAGAGKSGDARAGIEIKLQPGWHTYWRYPGDSGVPPRFDFAGSDNVATAQVSFPAPHAFTDEAGTIIGYKANVVLPVRIVPRQKNKPVTLRGKIDYAVCEKLCVPVEAKVELTLPPKSADNAALDAAEARVPKPVTAAQAGLSAKRTGGDKPKPQIFVDLAAPTGQPVELLVEGPTPDWALPIPKPAPGAPAGHYYFSFELDGLPPGVDPKSAVELTFTIVQGDRATEVKTHLD
ncbi:MAG TPA: protein-disulfide reductase DsbD domain-containing protein [Pseudolabrys sp.]|nr:protein-disulfide reductase DsbD domain-containing protein [Pseudolabrys sp.]